MLFPEHHPLSASRHQHQYDHVLPRSVYDHLPPMKPSPPGPDTSYFCQRCRESPHQDTPTEIQGRCHSIH